MFSMSEVQRRACEYAYVYYTKAGSPPRTPYQPFHKVKLLMPKHRIFTPVQGRKQSWDPEGWYWQIRDIHDCKVFDLQGNLVKWNWILVSPNHTAQGNLTPCGEHHHVKVALALNKQWTRGTLGNKWGLLCRNEKLEMRQVAPEADFRVSRATGNSLDSQPVGNRKSLAVGYLSPKGLPV